MTPSGQAVCLGLVLRLRCSWTSLIEFAAFAFIDHVPAVQPFKVKVLDENSEPDQGHVTVSTMHLAKGLEFRFVVVMACDDECVPSATMVPNDLIH